MINRCRVVGELAAWFCVSTGQLWEAGMCLISQEFVWGGTLLFGAESSISGNILLATRRLFAFVLLVL